MISINAQYGLKILALIQGVKRNLVQSQIIKHAKSVCLQCYIL